MNLSWKYSEPCWGRTSLILSAFWRCLNITASMIVLVNGKKQISDLIFPCDHCFRGLKYVVVLKQWLNGLMVVEPAVSWLYVENTFFTLKPSLTGKKVKTAPKHLKSQSKNKHQKKKCPKNVIYSLIISMLLCFCSQKNHQKWCCFSRFLGEKNQVQTGWSSTSDHRLRRCSTSRCAFARTRWPRALALAMMYVDMMLIS